MCRSGKPTLHFFPLESVWFKEEILGYRDLKTVVKEYIPLGPVFAFVHWALTGSHVKQQNRG